MEPMQEIFCRSLHLYQQGERQKALTLLNHGLERFAEASELWELRGLIQNREGAWGQAMISLERASHLAPLTSSASFALAICYLQNGKRDLGILVLRGLANSPRTPLALLPMVAATLGSLSEFVIALSACRNIVRRDSERHDAHFGVAYYLRCLRTAPRKYIAAIRTAHQLGPQVPLYRVVLAGFLEETGDREEASELLAGLDTDKVRCACFVNVVRRLLGRIPSSK
jgi:tetratricopeptide (TPR) repeat protein